MNTKLTVLVAFVASLAGGLTPCQADEGFTCPVTKTASIAFDPPSAFAGSREKLFGTEKLFTIFPGNWHTKQQSERGYRVPKIVWGSAVFDLAKEWERNTLTITGRRLDAASGSLEFDRANTARSGGGYFITSEFYVPTLGCWEVIGHFHGTDLKIVTDLK